MDKLFRLVFNNIYIFKTIYGFVKIYKRNEFKIFNNKQLLLEYTEREYITKIELCGSWNMKETLCSPSSSLEIGDLPNNGVLKEVLLTSHRLATVNCNVIPFGVETVQFPWQNGTDSMLSTLPSTVKKVINVAYIEEKTIPQNITSISFSYLPNFSSIDNGRLPRSIKELSFEDSETWENKRESILKKGDLPFGLTKLLLGDYNLKDIDLGIIPTTIRELSIECVKNFHDNNTNSSNNNNDKKNKKNQQYSFKFFNFLKPLKNLEILTISTNCKIIKNSNLRKCTSIKFLTIHGNCSRHQTFIEDSIEEYSLPPSITNLKLQNITNVIKPNVIPNSVTQLLIDRIEILELPQSLTSLKLYEKPAHFYTEKESLKLIAIFPPSLTKLTVPNSFENFNFNYPSNIKTIKFR